MRSLANAWMESKDPYMLISTSSIRVCECECHELRGPWNR
jgi:hypothetical protein